MNAHLQKQQNETSGVFKYWAYHIQSIKYVSLGIKFRAGDCQRDFLNLKLVKEYNRLDRK